MNESRFLSLMTKARMFSSRGEHADYWHGYQRGLRRGFQGELYGTEAEHKLWLCLADEGLDQASRERGRGYRDALKACAPADDSAPVAATPYRGGDPTVKINRGFRAGDRSGPAEFDVVSRHDPQASSRGRRS